MSGAPNFGLAHASYRAFRPPYPAAIYDRIRRELEPPYALAVDIGAGTGLVAAELCDRFARVIAVEPDPAMVAHLHEVAPAAQIQRVSAEQAKLNDASVDLVSCANALYWMDGPAVVAAVARWLRPGGVFAAWRYLFPRTPPSIEAVFNEEIERRWGQHRDPRVTETGVTRRWIDEQLGLTCFADLRVPNLIAMTPAQMVGFAASTSFGAAYLRTLAEPDAARYLAELEAKLAAKLAADIQGPKPTAEVDFELTLVLARAVDR